VILVAVGTQFPFDRLVRTVDEWAQRHGRTDVIAQVGDSNYKPRALKSFGFTEPAAFAELQEQAELLIAHAGMGSILNAMQFGKPIIVMPRDHLRGEHRNGHQLDTARRFKSVAGIHVAMDEVELTSKLDRFEAFPQAVESSAKASPGLPQYLSAFIENDQPPSSSWWRLMFNSGRSRPGG
jgi:UDP-N-acetylglucosamine transferase subunit ALG13